MPMLSQAVWCHCQVFTRICVHPERPWARGFQWHRHDFKGRAGMPMGREEQAFYSEDKGRVIGFFFAFGASMPMFSQAVWCHCQVFTRICVHPKRLCTRGFQSHRDSFKGRAGMPMGHANGPRKTVTRFRKYIETHLFFLCF